MLTGKSTVKKALRRPRRRWEDNIRMEEGRSAFNILTSKPTGKRPLERVRRRWEDNKTLDWTLRR